MVNNNFSEVINKILRDNNLTADERYLLIMLKTLSHKSGNTVCISYSEIIEQFGICRREKISSIIKALKEKEYIEVINGRYKNIYKIIKDYLVSSSTVGTTEKSSSSTIGTTEKFNSSTVGTTEKFSSSTVGTTEKSSSSTGGTTERSSSSAVGTTEEFNSSTVGTTGMNNTSNNINKNNTSNNINKNNINNKLYNNILKHWNSKNIRNESYLNIKTIDSINKAGINFTTEQIVQAINNYSEVYHSDYYYNFQWSLSNFLVKPNGLSSFLNDGARWKEYKSYKAKSMDIYQQCGLNYEDYIN